MKSFKIGRAIAAGLAGTMVMTAVMMMAPLMGMPKMDIAAMLGSMIAGAPPGSGSFAWIVGLIMHLMIGTVVLSTVYALASRHLPPSSPVAKGLIYGVLVWLVAQAVVMPMMGAGLFSSHMPQGMMMAMGSLLGHLIYGGVLGAVYGHEQAEGAPGALSTLKL